jgi:CDP-glucose 4,6-dehydratase
LGQREGGLENVVNPWLGRKVFLTGHSGFKGSWLALWLARKGAQVRGFSLPPESNPNLFTAAAVSSVTEDIRGDVREYAQVESALCDFAPEVVFHLAAQPLVRRSYSDPVGTFATNVMGVAHVLEAVRRAPSVRVVVCVTTDKCYDNKEWLWPYRETDVLGGHDPYSSSKACAEILTAAYRSSFFSTGHDRHVAIATVRAGNVIGGGDWSEDRLIPDLVRGFEAKQPVLIRRPGAVRPWQHVLAPLHGYLRLAEQLLAGEMQFASAFNFGPNHEDAWPVERIATLAAKMWGDGAAWVRDEVPSVHEAHYLRLDSSKARLELGWQPRLAIKEALEWTMSWYIEHARGADMRQQTIAQISAYEELK